MNGSTKKSSKELQEKDEKIQRKILPLVAENKDKLLGDCRAILNNIAAVPPDETQLLIQINKLHEKIGDILKQNKLEGEAGEFILFYNELFTQLYANKKLTPPSNAAADFSIEFLFRKIDPVVKDPFALMNQLPPGTNSEDVSTQMGQASAILNYMVPGIVGVPKYEASLKKRYTDPSPEELVSISNYVAYSFNVAELKKIEIPVLPRNIVNRLTNHAENKMCKEVINSIKEYNKLVASYKSTQSEEFLPGFRKDLANLMRLANELKEKTKNNPSYNAYADKILKSLDSAWDNLRLVEEQSSKHKSSSSRASQQDVVFNEKQDQSRSSSHRPSR